MTTDRIFPDIQNVAFHKITRLYAGAIGRPSFTLKQQRAALINYTFFAINRN
jgi:hypothetical protein